MFDKKSFREQAVFLSILCDDIVVDWITKHLELQLAEDAQPSKQGLFAQSPNLSLP